MTYKITFFKKKCIGCGACTFCDNWKFDKNMKVSPIKIQIDDIGCNQDAADICPVEAIKIEEI